MFQYVAIQLKVQLKDRIRQVLRIASPCVQAFP